MLGGLRRYSEFGVRLALGEEKKHIYRTTIYEAILIGIIGSFVGTVLGLALTYRLQSHGWDFSALTGNIGMMMPSVFRASGNPFHVYRRFYSRSYSHGTWEVPWQDLPFTNEKPHSCSRNWKYNSTSTQCSVLSATVK